MHELSQAPSRRYGRAMFTCPKCGGSMQTYSRAGLHVEQCTSCRGVFLDAGELERIVQAEGQWMQQQQHAPSAPPPPMPGQPAAPLGAHLGGHARHGHHQHGHRKPHSTRKTFLGELFDL